MSHSVGTISLLGLAHPFSVDPLPGAGDWKTYDAQMNSVPLPLAAPDARIVLSAAGRDYAPFTIEGRAIAPLVSPADPLVVSSDQPLTIAWDHAGQPGPGRIVATLAMGWARNRCFHWSG